MTKVWYAIQGQRLLSAWVVILLLVTAVVFPGPGQAEVRLEGSGASFPHRLYSIWFLLFDRENGGVRTHYVAKGSGGGIRDFLGDKVDFAASDAAMSEEEIAGVSKGVQLLPMTAGLVVLAYNLPGVETLQLPRAVYADIFLGRIGRWNDPAIVAANPGVALPDLAITVVTRADSSGTTFVFTKHLSAISEEWRQGPGFGKKVAWPKQLVRQESHINAGIASAVTLTPGAIGYIDLGFAQLADLQMASLENREGNYVAPSLASGQAALAEATLPPDLVAWLSDPGGAMAYPITTYTWMIFFKRYDDPAKAETLRKMIRFCIENGQKLSYRLGYIPLPESVAARVLEAAENIR